MKALILNSGMGSRMGVLTKEHPKCMTEISVRDTILSRQLKQLAEGGITEVVMTTGLFDGVLVNYCESLELPLKYTFVKNPVYRALFIFRFFSIFTMAGLCLSIGVCINKSETMNTTSVCSSSCELYGLYSALLLGNNIKKRYRSIR